MENTGQTLPDAGPTLGLFISGLANDGRIVVSPEPIAPPEASAFAALAGLNERGGFELASEPPDFCGETAIWAATLLYQICQFVVCREIGESQMAEGFAKECPVARGPATDWSADLFFRHLPSLFRLAQQLSNGDPLIQELKRLAAAWPLSSVGIRDLAELDLDSFIDHPALARLYADRIIAAADCSRLGDSRVDELLRADIGLHHDLAPEIANRLFPMKVAGTTSTPSPLSVDATANERRSTATWKSSLQG